MQNEDDDEKLAESDFKRSSAPFTVRSMTLMLIYMSSKIISVSDYGNNLFFCQMLLWSHQSLII